MLRICILLLLLPHPILLYQTVAEQAPTVPALSTTTELALSAVAGALGQIFTIPLSVVAMRQQVGRPDVSSSPSGTKGKETEDDNSFMAVARETIEEEGVTGLRPGPVLSVHPAITYGMFERIKSIVLLAKGTSSTKMEPFCRWGVKQDSGYHCAYCPFPTIVFWIVVVLLGHLSPYYG